MPKKKKTSWNISLHPVVIFLQSLPFGAVLQSFFDFHDLKTSSKIIGQLSVEWPTIWGHPMFPHDRNQVTSSPGILQKGRCVLVFSSRVIPTCPVIADVSADFLTKMAFAKFLPFTLTKLLSPFYIYYFSRRYLISHLYSTFTH